MSFESALADTTKNSELKKPSDFRPRAQLSEWMDEPCSYSDLRECLHDLAQVNRITLAYRPTLQWLQQVVRQSRAMRPLHIVDVGCGGGDMLRRIEHWAVRKRISVRLTGIDLNPLAVRVAREFTPIDSRIRWIAGKMDSIDTASDPVDLVICSLFTHHLADDEIVRVLAWMESVARRGWFINDLYRSRVSYVGFKALAMAARWHHLVRRDGPVSILRAFLPSDWRRYAEASGLPAGSVHIDIRWPARLCVARIKEP
ncbi:methyltransferase domain-containing protein [Terracidiphilus sp.]|jgi:SAM-dependent methyltransferase|uniref:methyltransferase domain-containing protein n=1 Tax=Terracidiphilus sp. TaxID=1964191 RepID=UPI003C1FD2C5